jgi:hypothetical protein
MKTGSRKVNERELNTTRKPNGRNQKRTCKDL